MKKSVNKKISPAEWGIYPIEKPQIKKLKKEGKKK